MRIHSFLCVLLIAALLLGLTACGVRGGEEGAPPFNVLPTAPADAQNSMAPSVPETAPAAETTQAPTEPASPVPQVNGADSVKTLIEKSLEYFRSDCDYEKLADVHDQQAYLGWFLMDDLYRDEDLSLDEAMDKAALLFGDAETLREKDPELADLVMDEMDAEEPEEFLSDYMNELRDAFRSGEITEADADYEHLSGLLADWDKGPDYIFEHYPELLERAEEANMAVGLDGALKLMRKFARFEVYNTLSQFRDLETEYRPENTYVDASGICSYDMGYVAEGNNAWSIDMMYYVRDGIYYLIGYSISLGTVGG